MPGHVGKRAAFVLDEDNAHGAPLLSARRLAVVVLAGIWITVSIMAGYYVGEPYLKKNNDGQQDAAPNRDRVGPGSVPPSAAGSQTRDAIIARAAELTELRLLREEVASLRFWLLLAWAVEVVGVGLVVILLAARGRRFGRRLMRQLTRLNAGRVAADPPSDPRAEARALDDEFPIPWPPAEGDHRPLSALTASLRRNREAIARSKIELANRSASEFTLR